MRLKSGRAADGPRPAGGSRRRPGPLRAQQRRLGIPSGSPAGGGGPGARESAARGRDLSGRPRLSTQPPPPPVLYGETDGVLEFSTLKYII